MLLLLLIRLELVLVIITIFYLGEKVALKAIIT
jgi:hypothetical protein